VILERLGNCLDDRQFGALRQRNVDNRESVRTVFIDFAKAFDYVDHNVVVNKLVSLGLPDIIVRWICAFLRERRQRVKIGNVLSDWLQLSAGMPQGSYLGPLTFVILIDSLQPGCLSHKYVDDTMMTEVRGSGQVGSQQHAVIHRRAGLTGD